MKNKRIGDLIEKAKELSKEQFISFTKAIFDVEADTWSHLWEVPIITTYEGDRIIAETASEELSDEQLEDLLGEIDECIDEQISDYEAVFITFGDIILHLNETSIETDQELYEKYSKILTQDYDSIIVYSESKLEEKYNEIQTEYSNGINQKTQEEIDELFTKQVAKIFTHERCHLNANTMLDSTIDPDNVPIINGMQLVDDIEYDNYNEVCIDTLAFIIQYYKPGMDIQDCLYKVIKSRNGETGYSDFDDRLILSLYAIYPKEMTEWMLFEAYDDLHINYVYQKIKEMFPNDVPDPSEGLSKQIELLKGIGNYYNKICANNIKQQDEKTVKLLEMIGVKNIKEFSVIDACGERKIDISQIKAIAEDESIIREIPGVLNKIQMAQKNTTNKKTENKEDNDFIK